MCFNTQSMAQWLWFSLIIFSILLTISESQTSSNCWISRSHAQTKDKDVFIPECTRDGLFASVQCHRSSGYCWCVDVMTGRPKSQTTTRNRSPNCNNSGRRSTGRDPNRRKEKRLCNSSQRVLFNTQLLSVFVSENSRKTGQQNESSISQSIDNKFNELDMDLDHRITRQETRDLVQLIKKLFPSFRVCAQQMFTFCDQNNDSFITKPEFKECLNFDFSFRAFLSLNSTNSEDYRSDSGQQPKKIGFQNPFQLNSLSNREQNLNESRLDCYITRANALESAKVNPYGELFIPECTKDGYYVRIQCHKSYCWCVSRVSGQPIKTLQNISKNSENYNQNNCESIRKGCDQRRRNKFHLKLRQLLEREGSSCDGIFNKIDSNGNEFIENNEWKHFRQIWRKSQIFSSRLRKCFRTEMNYCDQNYDKKVAKAEWVQCCQPLNTSQSSNESSGSLEEGFTANRRSHKKLGPNPFLTILQSE